MSIRISHLLSSSPSLPPLSAAGSLMMKASAKYRRGDVERISDALVVADLAHAGARWGNLPYISHPIAVAANVMDVFGERAHPDVVVAAVLHDVVEDAPDFISRLQVPVMNPDVDRGIVPLAVIANMFGDDVASIVDAVSNDADADVDAYVVAVDSAVTSSFGAFAVKFADFVSNAGGLCSGSVKPARAKRLGAKYARVIPSYREAAALWDVDAAALDIIDDIEGGINSLL